MEFPAAARRADNRGNRTGVHAARERGRSAANVSAATRHSGGAGGGGRGYVAVDDFFAQLQRARIVWPLRSRTGGSPQADSGSSIGRLHSIFTASEVGLDRIFFHPAAAAGNRRGATARGTSLRQPRIFSGAGDSAAARKAPGRSGYKRRDAGHFNQRSACAKIFSEPGP